MNLIDTLVLRNLHRVGDKTLIKILIFSICQGVRTLEDLLKFDLVFLFLLNFLFDKIKRLLFFKIHTTVRQVVVQNKYYLRYT